MDLKEIKELINLMNQHSLIEIEVEKEGMKIRLKKNYPENIAPVATNDKILEKKFQNSSQSTPLQETEIKTKSMHIKSPMIGTFYRTPHPDAPVFINTGDVIEPGQVICIIEAMKLMNEIKAEVRGKVVEVLVNNGDPVEFGQPLFSVEPF